MKKEFVPLIFAGDINVYSVARAFHEEYGIKSFAYGKYPHGPCMNSKILNYYSNERVDEQETFLRLVWEFADEHMDEKVLLIGCGDNYVQLISQNKQALPDNVIAPYIDAEMMNGLIHKEKFYSLCERMGVDFPVTYVHRKEMGLSVSAPFDGPYIIKPSNGIEYWKHPYPSQKKVYKEDEWSSALRVLGDIYNSGYDDSVIVQNFIPGDDSYMRVLTCYSDKTGKVKMMCLGHVLLEEHTPHGLGNHAVIITEKNRELMERFKDLLESLGYVGFSNFDIKYDRRDGSYRVFEINARQGRSNYYVTGAGGNIAKLLVEDYVLDNPMEFRAVEREHMFTVVPDKVAFKYIYSEEYRSQMRRLIGAGEVSNPLKYECDTGFIRRLRVFKNMHRHYAAFKKYYR